MTLEIDNVYQRIFKGELEDVAPIIDEEHQFKLTAEEEQKLTKQDQ